MTLEAFANIDEDEATMLSAVDDWELAPSVPSHVDTELDDVEEDVPSVINRRTPVLHTDSLVTFGLSRGNINVIELLCKLKYDHELEQMDKCCKQTATKTSLRWSD